MPPTLERAGVGEASVARFEFSPNHRDAALTPLTLHEGTAAPIVPDVVPYLLNSYFVVAPEEPAQPPVYGEPAFRVPYPASLGAFLRIGALTVMPDALGPTRPAIMFVVDLTGDDLQLRREPPTISRVALMGNLFLPPTYDSRGTLHNFGLPRALRIYAASWRKPFGPPENLPPHPRSWQLLYEDTDLRGRWGWTYLNLSPTRTSHLIFVMSHFPVLPNSFDYALAKEASGSGIPWHFRGLAVERLAIHAYESATCDSEYASYVPLTSWNDLYEGSPFVSRFWTARGVAQPLPAQHQSIYREAMKPYDGREWGFDLQPSALVGLPLQVSVPSSLAVDADNTGDGYVFRRYYSGDVMIGTAAVITSLVVEMADTQAPSLRGLRLKVPPVSRPEQEYATPHEMRCYIYGTDDLATAFSSNPLRDGWTLIHPSIYDFSAEDFGSALNFFYGQEVLFRQVTTYRFYRLEFARDPAAGGSFTGRKRFELEELVFLRAIHPTLVAQGDEVLRLDEVLLRVSGPNLLDDYEYVNGQEIMDVRLQRLSRDKPYEEILQIRSLLDMREKTAAQVIAAQRGTRARVQYFVDYQEPSKQDSVSISKQEMLAGKHEEIAALRADPLVTKLADGSDPTFRANLRAEVRNSIGRVLTHILGIKTERNTNLGGTLQLLQVLDQAGIPASDLVQLMTCFANSSFDELADVGGNALLGGLRSGLSTATGGLSDTLIDWIDGDDDEATPIDFTSLLLTPTTLVKILNGLPASAPNSAIQTLDYRPAVSLSASFGAQFIAGGSFGLSAQLDSGKSTSLSTGEQGQALHSVTITDESLRRSSREEEVERTNWFDWKGQDVKRAGVPLDIITIRLPLGLVLTPPSEGGEGPDTFRIKIAMLPPNVKVETVFVGQRRRLDRRQP